VHSICCVLFAATVLLSIFLSVYGLEVIPSESDWTIRNSFKSYAVRGSYNVFLNTNFTVTNENLNVEITNTHIIIGYAHLVGYLYRYVSSYLVILGVGISVFTLWNATYSFHKQFVTGSAQRIRDREFGEGVGLGEGYFSESCEKFTQLRNLADYINDFIHDVAFFYVVDTVLHSTTNFLALLLASTPTLWYERVIIAHFIIIDFVIFALSADIFKRVCQFLENFNQDCRWNPYMMKKQLN